MVDEGNCDDARTLEELCSVAGLDGLQADARKGRADGAKFCWKPAMGDDTAGAAKTTSTSSMAEDS